MSWTNHAEGGPEADYDAEELLTQHRVRRIDVDGGPELDYDDSPEYRVNRAQDEASRRYPDRNTHLGE